MDVSFHRATVDDVPSLAVMNQTLIRDEGHRNPMSSMDLTERMRGWLTNEYEAVIFQHNARDIGYALFRRDAEHVYLRQFFVEASSRRHGIGRMAIAWLWEHAWPEASRVRLDILVNNETANRFWAATGFTDYCITMEATRPE